MKPVFRNRPFLTIARLILLAALCVSALAGLGPAAVQPAAAQQASGDEWSPPANLSQNGSATTPVPIADGRGGLHAIWIDNFDGLVYSRFTGETWLPPIAPTFPFAAFLPDFLADQQGNVHAFWLDKQGGLFYSRAAAGDIGSAVWSQAFRITDSAVAFAAALDSLDRLHVAFVRTQSIPGFAPGVYYRRSFTGDAWFTPVSIYETPYFRNLTAANAHVDIAVTDLDAGSVTPGRGQQEVYITLDNRPRERVLLAKSSDSGETWGAPADIDSPAAESGSRGASNLMVYADGPKVMLLWQASQSGAACSQLYQVSSDGGNTWSSRQPLDSAGGCPALAHLFPVSKPGAQTNPSRLYGLLINENQQQVTLRLWDGTTWGTSQDQPVLSYFLDPDSQRTVTFACRKFAVGAPFKLYAAGCDTGGGGDAWMLSRSLDGLVSGAAEVQVWSSPLAVASDLAPALDPVLVAGSNGLMHALWSQADPGNPADTGDALYYSQWNGQSWSRPLQALRSPDGKANQPAAALDNEGRLLVAWSGGRSGEIFFSWANADRATSALEWNAPVKLQGGPGKAAPNTVRLAGSRPQILVDGAGQIAVAYAAPFNEGRGIYFTRSSGDGAVWSPPVQVYDAAAAGWERVDEPRLALAGDGSLSLLWTTFSLPGGAGPLALFYSRSTDGGRNWSPAEMIVENPVQWAALLPGAGNSLHRLWQQVDSEQKILWHQVSQDGGAAWGQATTIPSLGGIEGPAAAQPDSLGRLQLVRINRDPAAGFVLRHLQWEAGRWISEGELTSPGSLDLTTMALSLGVSPDGALAVLYTRPALPAASGLTELVYASRTIALIEGAAPQPPGVMPTLDGGTASPSTSAPTSAAGAAGTPQPGNATPAAPQATLTPTSAVDNQPGPAPQNSLTGVILWVLPASLLVGAVFVGALLYNWLKSRY